MVDLHMILKYLIKFYQFSLHFLLQHSELALQNQFLINNYPFN
jgi:hypothetical protein